MRLDAYLKRVGYDGAPRADVDTLTRLHRAHLNAIPYETLDVMLGEPLGFEHDRIFDKLVTRRRGGWCYEMNGLFGWALEEIGFKVTRIACNVIRDRIGETFLGNHLALLVELDRTYLADVGFGDGLYEPTPLAEGPVTQQGFVSGLELRADGWWRFHNHQNCGAPTFDFRVEPADPARLAHMCEFLQTSDLSPFRQNVVLQRRLPDRVEIIRNAVRMTARPDRLDRRLLASEDEFVAEMRDVFGIDVPAARTLWPKAQERAAIMLAENPI